VRTRIGLFLFAAAAFAWSLHYVTGDWEKSLLGLHQFRQTQTAITCYWFQREGFRLDYQTPVLGAPWSIPFEFPFYQALVTLVAQITRAPLDATGRAVSVSFALATLWPIERILRWWLRDPLERAFILLTLWVTPVSLYWSNSFMIESTALFFCLLFLYSAVEFARTGSFGWALLATGAGLVGALQKITVFLIIVVPTLALAAKACFKCRRSRWIALSGTAAALLIPVLATAVWTHYADMLKSSNPLAVDLTSSELGAWNFGTMEQRLNIGAWARIFYFERIWGLAHGDRILLFGAVSIIVAALICGPRRYEILALLCGYLSGPIIFTNLFFNHNYYLYENSVLLSLAFVLSLSGLIRSLFRSSQRKGLALPICLGLVSVLALASYRPIWKQRRKVPSSQTVARWLQPLDRVVDNEGVLLIYGLDWNPSLPYYARRKAIMDRTNRSLESPTLQRSLELLPRAEQVSAMIIGQKANLPGDFVKQRLEYFHLSSVPIATPWGPAYIRVQSGG
jgi:hypothetical protein